MTSSKVSRPEDGLEHAACALCGADDPAPLLHGSDVRRGVPGRFAVVRCRRCRLAYVNPRPTESAIARYYPADYGPHETHPPSRSETIYYRLFRKLPAPPGARILDVGCGGGKYLSFLRQRGYDVAGVDVDTELMKRLRRDFGLETYAGLITQAPIPETSFDVVTLWWVLEHTHDPLGTLRAAHRVLREGGKIVVGLQNFASLGRLIFGARWHHLDIPGHLYQLEPQTLREILRSTGFEVFRLRHDLIAKDFAPSLGYALHLPRSLDRALPNLLALPFDLLAWCVRRSGLITAYASKV